MVVSVANLVAIIVANKVTTLVTCILVIAGAFGFSSNAFASEKGVGKAKENEGTKGIIMGVIDIISKNEFESKRLSFLKDQVRGCLSCEIKNFSAYNDKGESVKSDLLKIFKEHSKEATFWYFPWNEKKSSENQAFFDHLKEFVKDGGIVVTGAGRADGDGPIVPLARTLFGQLEGAFVIGEITDRETFVEKSYHGPELFAAVKPPRDFQGQFRAADLFASKLLLNWSKRSRNDWPTFLRGKKSASNRIWPPIEEFFPR